MFAFLCCLFTAQAEPVEYQFDTKTTDLYVTVYKDDSTLLSSQAHNHAIRAKNYTGKLNWDSQAPESCDISISFPVEEMEVDSAQARALAASKESDPKIKKGFEKTISPSQQKDVQKNMLSTGQLNAAQHKTISFQSTKCTADSITGNFTLKGVSKEITMPAKIKTATEGPWKLLIKGQFNIKATDFGFKPYSGLGGAVANQDTMRINVYIRGI